MAIAMLIMIGQGSVASMVDRLSTRRIQAVFAASFACTNADEQKLANSNAVLRCVDYCADDADCWSKCIPSRARVSESCSECVGPVGIRVNGCVHSKSLHEELKCLLSCDAQIKKCGILGRHLTSRQPHRHLRATTDDSSICSPAEVQKLGHFDVDVCENQCGDEDTSCWSSCVHSVTGVSNACSECAGEVEALLHVCSSLRSSSEMAQCTFICGIELAKCYGSGEQLKSRRFRRPLPANWS